LMRQDQVAPDKVSTAMLAWERLLFRVGQRIAAQVFQARKGS
jgi:hypothetical protein